MRPTPPGHLESSDNDRKDDRAQFEAELADLQRKIDKAEDNLLSSEDERALKSLDAKISKMHDERECLIAELDRKEWDAVER